MVDNERNSKVSQFESVRKLRLYLGGILVVLGCLFVLATAPALITSGDDAIQTQLSQDGVYDATASAGSSVLANEGVVSSKSERIEDDKVALASGTEESAKAAPASNALSQAADEPDATEDNSSQSAEEPEPQPAEEPDVVSQPAEEPDVVSQPAEEPDVVSQPAEEPAAQPAENGSDAAAAVVDSNETGDSDSSAAADANASEASTDEASSGAASDDGSSAAADAGSSESAASTDAASSTSAASAGSVSSAAASVSASAAAAKMPAVEFEKIIERTGAPDVKVKVIAPEGAFPEGTTMEAKLLAADTVQDKVQEAIERENGEEVVIKEITAVDIVFKDKDGKEIEPAKKVEVKITSNDVRDFEDPVLVHVLDKEKDSSKGAVVDAEVVGKVKIVNEDDDNHIVGAEDTMKFESEAFSPYVIVEYELVEGASEHIFTASDGTNYRIVVTCPPDAGIPENASLTVTEITQGDSAYGTSYDEYVSSAENALGFDQGSTAGVRLFDIKIVDKDNPSITYQPAEGTAVDVRIELADVDGGDYDVVHFAEGKDAGNVVEGVAAEDGAVSFATNGFSVYAIVPGPEPVPFGWEKVMSLSELATRGASGVRVGQIDGYYFTNALDGPDNKRRIGIKKTKPASSTPPSASATYYFEQVPGTDNQFYAYCFSSGGERQYVYNGGNNSLSLTTEDKKTAFTVAVDSAGKFTFYHDGWYWNMQGSANGNRFCSWNENNNDSKMYVWYEETVDEDPYKLDGQSRTLLVWDGGATGKAMASAANDEPYGNNLGAEFLTVMSKKGDADDKLYVPDDTSAKLTSWTFTWAQNNDRYYLSADVEGATKYLSIDSNGLHMVDEPSEIQVVPGSGIHAGQICMKGADGTTLAYSGKFDAGFTIGGDPGSEWLYLAEPRPEGELVDYSRTYSAKMVSISDREKVYGSNDPYAKQDHGYVIYTRAWNGHGYSYFALNGEGHLVPCVESGDSIEWIGGNINDMVWWFTEYTDDKGGPTNYYELFSQSANGGNGAFLAPLVSNGQILSNDVIGLMMPGRVNGQYYSPILTWDANSYTYAGLKVDLDQADPLIESCIRSESLVFYLATMEELPKDSELTTVATVDNNQYGITMKLANFGSRKEMSDFLGSDAGGLVVKTDPGLLSTNLVGEGENAYPTATKTGNQLASFFSGAQVVNKLFLESTYQTTGYYEFDSSQNFASLKGKTSGDFTVYKELGTSDEFDRETLKHGQFFPYNDIQAGLFSESNPRNLYSAEGAYSHKQLPDSDPRKNEQLYVTKEKTDYFFGMELTASFIQTPSGLDAWGHDIIFEFSGDDDFWLYVDGELVIDLGGIHSALPGTVNFRTGEVNVNGKYTTLRDLFRANYTKRGLNPDDADKLFVLNGEGNYVFKDDSQHTMRIFYLERGAGASNLHMRFNLASVKKGTVQLSKKLEVQDGDASESDLAIYPYQIWFKNPKTSENERLTNKFDANVVYKDSVKPVDYRETMTVTKNVDGAARSVEYQDVFLLKPSEIAEITFPIYGQQGAEQYVTDYWIVECGIDDDVYSTVKANDTEIQGKPQGDSGLSDYAIDHASPDDRPRVIYENTAKETKSLTIEKELYNKDTGNKIELYDKNGNAINSDNPDLQRTFDFRLYFKTAYDDDFAAANMYPYHVKDPAGYYCKWDKGVQGFVRITHDGAGVANFNDLTDEEKTQATFDTSTNGSISQIPAYYTVEARGLIPGTQFKVVERPAETPDGYMFYEYKLNDVTQPVEDALVGVQGTIESGAAAKSDVTVCNYKGYGLRLNKVWADAESTEDRDPTYFAVYYETGTTTPTLVSGSVRQLKFTADPKAQTVYWYYQNLPQVEGASGDVSLNNYVVREVTLTGDIVVDDSGVVSGYGSITPVVDSEFVRLNATPTDGAKQLVTYKVTYDEPTHVGDNVIVYSITNTPDDRPVVKLVKEDWVGNPLANAEFTLKSAESGTVMGTYTSSSTGLIRVAYLDYGKTYILTETKSPQGYVGLPLSLAITIPEQSAASQDVTVTPFIENRNTHDISEYYTLVQRTGNEPATLTIKDHAYVFQVIKVDASNPNTKVPGAKFQVHKQIKVGDKYDWDPNPMTWDGESILVSDSNGVIPHLDKDLPAGTYQLREFSAPGGYERLEGDIDFTISATGVVTLGSHPEGVVIGESVIGDEGAITYTISVPNVGGTVFPITGGVGTVSLTVIGILFIVAAVFTIGFNTRRRHYV